jgi:hypothetical protein
MRFVEVGCEPRLIKPLYMGRKSSPSMREGEVVDQEGNEFSLFFLHNARPTLRNDCFAMMASSDVCAVLYQYFRMIVKKIDKKTARGGSSSVTTSRDPSLN